jgi:hypothetical protein
MNAIAMTGTRSVLGVCQAALWMCRIWICCISVNAWGQDSTIPGSLGELARQTRAQHATIEDKFSKAQDLVDEMQQAQEAADNAPTGFKNYDAGDYRLFVPFPFSLEGRENGGAVLLGSRLGVTTTEVMAGTPIPISVGLSDSDVANLVRQLARQYSQSGCSAIKRGSHKAFRCSMSSGYLLGHEITGSMEYILASHRLIPVMCVSPDDRRRCTFNAYGYQTCGDNPYPSWDEAKRTKAAIETQYREQLTSTQMCDQIIYPSIQLKEDIVLHPASISEGKTPKIAAESVPQDNSVAAYGSQTASLAELARQTRQAPHDKAQATLDNAEGTSVAPKGFQAFTLQYCRNPQECSEASVVIPEKAEVVSRVNGQHIFKAALDGDSVMLYVGPADVNAPYRSLTDPDYIRMRDLANSNGWSREKADDASTQQLTIEGRPALMTRFRYQRDQRRWWIGERVLIDRVSTEDQKAQFLVGCAAPEEHFADAEILCTTIVNSLRLP